ncbi:MAG: DUF11 domain-containing protein, partial [Saprospiraceae bacterium]|nr:DUF11 domain-containing protein [Saprospiraceae bacterium]
MTIVVQNTGGLLSAGALLTVTLPDGLTYLPGSVSNVTEQNISNLAVPVFSLPAIPGGASVEARLIIRADCRADVAVNTGTQFFIQMAVTAPNVSVSASTLGFVVETGQIIITGVSDLLMEGERFDTLYRTICVTNTRLGKIGDIYFEDSHPMGISVSVQNATPLFNTPFQYKALISQSLFTSLGNNDQWLDENEEVCFTEQIIITDCGFPEHLLPSNLNVGWGCAGDTCDSHSVLAHILVHPSTKVQELSFKRISNPITDNCGVVGATMGLSIKNIGQADATNVSVKFAIPTKYEENSIDQNSFRIVESNGVSTSISPNLTTLNPDFDCNPGSSKEVSVNVPLVLLQDSVQLLFDLLSCADACNQLEALINVEYFYRKDCPSNGFVSDTLILYTDTGYKINAGITTNVADCFFSGNSYSAIYKVRSKKFTQPDGFLHLELSMPSGISLDSSCNTTLNGISPLSVEITGTPYQGYTIHWIYALPLPSEDVQMDFCLNYKCDSTTVCSPATSGGDGVYNVYAVDCRPCFGKLGQRSYWTPTATTNTDCGIGTCSEYNLVLDNCNENETTGDGNPPAGLTWKFETKRLNRGFKDSDDDRINDDDTIAPEEEVRLDRYLAGDTMQVFYCARLDSGSLPSLRRVIYHEAFRSDFGGAADNDQVDPYGLKEYFCNAFTFRFLDDSIRIHYASGETVGFSIYDLIKTDDKNLINILIPNNFPNDVLDVLASKNHEFFADFNDLFQQGLLPFPNLSPGDSIFFYTRFKIGMNFNPIPQGKTDPALIGFRTAMNHSNTLFAWRLFPSQRMQYSGFLFRRNMPIFNIKPCEPSIEVKKFKYAIRIARENLFPFEVRPLATLNDFKITTPPGLVVSNVNLEYLALQDSTVLTNDLPLPYAETPGLLDIDFTPAFEFKLDEGFMLGTSTIFEANCTLRHPDSSQLDLITQFEGCLNGDSMIQHDRIKSQIGYFTNHPNLELITNDSILISASRDFEVNFNIKNPFVNSALHPWISIQSLSGLSTNFKLFKQPQNQT